MQVTIKAKFKWQWFTLAVLLAGCAAASCQAPENCSPGTDYEAEGYHIRNARIDDPWHFLMAFGTSGDAADQAVAALRGKPYNNAELRTLRDVIEKQRFLPAEINYSIIAVDNCSGKQLNVIFHIFSVQISPILSSTFEFRQLEKTAPQEAAGSSENGQYFRVVPRAGYDQTEKFFSGGNIEAQWPATVIPLDSFSVEGYGSSSTRLISAALAGHYDSAVHWLGHAEWRLEFQNSSLPTDRAALKQGWLGLQLTGELHPVQGWVPRFGMTVAGGNQQSGFTAGDLAPHTVASSGYGSAKFYGGITTHLRHQVLAASYGIELGSRGAMLRSDWRKHIGDIAHEYWWPVGDHRLFEIEQRFTAGRIQVSGAIPVSERFFGGNAEQQFVPSDTWKIRSNPVIRSIPANRFYRTSTGAGGDRFVSYNLTAAVTVWRKPIVPGELTSDAEFNNKLNGAMVSSTNLLQVAYASEDPNFHDLLSLLPDVAARLEQLSAAVTNAQASAPSSLGPAFKACTKAIASSTSGVRHARDDKPVQAYGWAQELLPDGSSSLADAVSACGTDLNETLNDPAIASASSGLDAAAQQLQTRFGLIDQDAASAKAAADMSYVRRTLDIILKEMNIASISPVFMFDAAHIGPATSGPYSGTRYGSGGGIRFSLVSTVSFTAGYAWNLNRHPGEGAGALFFSLSTRSLFH